MEIFNSIYEVLTTPDMETTNLICSPLVFLEVYVSMLLFTTILNIKVDKRHKIIYVLALSIETLFSRFLIPNPYRYIA